MVVRMKTTLTFLLTGLFSCNAYADQVLVTIGESGRVTERQLESAMLAAPFASQFPVMDEDDQAYLRGDMLLRLARAEALYQEALTTGIQQQPVFQQEMNNFATTTLAQRYLYRLRQHITIPEAIEHQLEQRVTDHGDALTAARSAYIANRFTEAKRESLQILRAQADVKTFFDRLDEQPSKDTVLAKGNGVTIRYGDLITTTDGNIDRLRIEAKVDEWIALTLMARAAKQQGEDIDAQLADYRRDLAIRLLLAQQEKKWLPTEQTLIDYFQRHPELGYIPERRQIGQIVLKTREQAEQIHQRIIAGESLFELAGLYSIDPYGRQRKGDMGWLHAGSAAPEIEQALTDLPDDRVSKPIQTKKGWHLVIIVDRKPAEQRDFAAIKDRVSQKLVAEKMEGYLREVTQKYPLQWQIAEHVERKTL